MRIIAVDDKPLPRRALVRAIEQADPEAQITACASADEVLALPDLTSYTVAFVDIDMPGFRKEDISLELQNGYLTVTATKGLDKDTTQSGKVIRKERYSGTMQRSFYVGDTLTEADISAKLDCGVLSLCIPKKEARKIPEKKVIMIEG